ncbi:MAG TPA: squalene/phytoene synthase family protein [Acetobacteraceae bacterium]|nr:squalene/phytoene synthase family protein [Acetobacteraceae bacterium]
MPGERQHVAFGMVQLRDTARKRDPDRYFCALFAPGDRREALFTLIAFNDALARAQEVAREPGLALIRLQWWREVVEGADRRHPVASPLRAMLADGAVPATPLLGMIAARDADVEGPPDTLEAFVERMREGPGGLAVAQGAALGASTAEQARLRDLGAAYGIAGTLRNVPALAAQQRVVLPVDVLAAAGLVPEAAFERPLQVANAARPALAAAASRLLGNHTKTRRAIIAAALPAVLARRDLRALVTTRGVSDRLAVTAASVHGWV